MKKIVVIGAGIIGTTLAWRLSRAGADVTVIDRGLPAGLASGRSFGWINATYHHDAHHFRLRAEGMAAWHRLEAELGEGLVNWSGTLWWEEQGEEFDRVAAELRELGYPVEELGRDRVARMEPAIVPPERALRLPSEGAADPARVVTRLSQGLRVISGLEVQAITERGGRVTGLATAEGAMEADHVVLAGGTGAPALAEPLGVALPMLRRPGVLMRTAPATPRLSHLLVTPAMELRQLPTGALLAPTAASHQSDDSEEVDPPAQMADRALTRLREVLPGAPGWDRATLAWRPVPGDGLPVAGAAGPEGLTLAVMHSGVTLAPVMAELLAHEILREEPAPMLAPYRPGRFAAA
ncbi:FAD-dependent oxidoreductase [Aquicoccus sp. SCR17]|nr:FAD-dependent oxidoreductase [Carideicomes alvinocaridis]